MSQQSVQAHFTYHLANSRVRNWPFPHLYYENVFPDDYYSNLIGSIPGSSLYKPIEEVRNITTTTGRPFYPDRSVILLDDDADDLSPEWEVFKNIFHSDETRFALLDKFIETVRPRLYDNSPLESTVQLIRDSKNYSIGPHTDNPIRYVVILIYLPETAANPHIGTSIYVPNEPGVTCPGGPHYKGKNFTRVFTAPYVPNSALAFVKTENSFHGVEPLIEDIERNLVQCFVKKLDDVL